jgi:hypothetical protein
MADHSANLAVTLPFQVGDKKVACFHLDNLGIGAIPGRRQQRSRNGDDPSTRQPRKTTAGR